MGVERVVRRLLAAALFVVLIGRVLGAAKLEDTDFVDERVAHGFQLATDLCVLPSTSDTRFLVLEKDGVVKLVVDGQTQAQAVLDIQDQVHSYGDKGLVGCTLDVDFDRGRRFLYLAFAYGGALGDVKRASNGRLVRYELNRAGTEVLVGTEKVLLGTASTGEGCDGINVLDDTICCVDAHCMGGIAMTDSGVLIAAVGDGVNSGGGPEFSMTAQNPYTLNGKLLRMDRSGGAVPSNPFFDLATSATDNVAKVVALGLRNPWRLAWDEALSKVWISDVQWNDWEEVNLGDFTGQRNFGWPCIQGEDRLSWFAQYDDCEYARGDPRVPTYGVDTPPVLAFAREFAASVSGAGRLGIADWPSAYRDKIFVTDYVKSNMRYFEVDASGARTDAELPALFASNLDGPVKILESPAGDALWYLSLLAQEVRQIRYSPDTSAPVVTLHNPPNGALAIERTASIEVVFSKRMQADSVGAAFSLTDTTTLADVAGSFSYEADAFRMRFRPDASLAADRTYRCRVGTGAADRNGKGLESALEWEFTTGSGFTTFVSDLPFEVAVNGLGPPERDMTNGDEAAGDGETIMIRGIAYERGIGVIPDSEVGFALPDGCTRFQATIGVDDSSTNVYKSWVHFEVLADGNKVYRSKDEAGGPLTRGNPPLEVDVDVAGAAVVSLVVNRTKDLVLTHMMSSWANARFRCGDFDSTAPEVVSSTPEGGDVDVETSPLIVVAFSEPMDLSSLAAALRLRQGDTAVGFTLVTQADVTVVTLEAVQLAPSTVYTLSVNQLARDLAGNALRETFEASFTTGGGEATLMLTEMEPTSMTLGATGAWEVSPTAVSIAGTSFAGGFVTVPWAQAVFDVPLSCREFRAEVGVPDGAGPDASVKLLVKTAGGGTCKTGVLRAAGAHESVSCSLENVKKVRLAVQKGGDDLRDDAMVIAQPRFEGCLEVQRAPRCDINPVRQGFRVGNWISFEGKGFDFRGVKLPRSRLSWEVKQHHCPAVGACHFHPLFTLNGVNRGRFQVDDHGEYYYFEVVCTVCDRGLCTSTTASSYPQTTLVTVDSSPSGLVGGLDGLNGQFPMTQRVVLKARFSFSVIPSQGLYEFEQWRHDGSRSPTNSFKVRRNKEVTFVAEFS